MVLRRVIYLALAAMMAFMVSCKDKDEETQQPTPEPEPTPVVPTKEITIDFDFFDNWGNINKDTVKKYADMEDVKFVFLNIVNEDGGRLSSGLSTSNFHRVRDTLQTRFDISPKVCGSGTIYVHPEIGAQVPDGELAGGMCVSDSAWYASKGYQIKRFPGVTSRSSR